MPLTKIQLHALFTIRDAIKSNDQSVIDVIQDHLIGYLAGCNHAALFIRVDNSERLRLSLEGCNTCLASAVSHLFENDQQFKFIIQQSVSINNGVVPKDENFINHHIHVAGS